MGSLVFTESPARNRVARLLVGLVCGALVLLLMSVDTAQATSCSGSIATVTNSTPRGTRTTVNLQFSCDPALGANTGHLVFHVRFGGDEVGDLESDSVQCESNDTNEFDCWSLTGQPVPAGTVISVTPIGTDDLGTPVCSAARRSSRSAAAGRRRSS
jgi:hypothetical protein